MPRSSPSANGGWNCAADLRVLDAADKLSMARNIVEALGYFSLWVWASCGEHVRYHADLLHLDGRRGVAPGRARRRANRSRTSSARCFHRQRRQSARRGSSAHERLNSPRMCSKLETTIALPTSTSATSTSSRSRTKIHPEGSRKAASLEMTLRQVCRRCRRWRKSWQTPTRQHRSRWCSPIKSTTSLSASVYQMTGRARHGTCPFLCIPRHWRQPHSTTASNGIVELSKGPSPTNCCRGECSARNGRRPGCHTGARPGISYPQAWSRRATASMREQAPQK